jgi:hypothetical protein
MGRTLDKTMGDRYASRVRKHLTGHEVNAENLVKKTYPKVKRQNATISMLTLKVLRVIGPQLERVNRRFPLWVLTVPPSTATYLRSPRTTLM